MSLSIKTIDFVFLFIIKAFIRKILLIAALNFITDWVIMMHLDASLVILWLSNNSLIGYIPDEMVVGVRVRMEEVDKHLVLCDPATGNERVCEVIINHGVVIEANQLVDLYLRLLDLLLISLLFSKDTETKQPVVKVDTRKLLSIMVLLHLFHSYILLLATSNLFLKSLFVSLDRVHLNKTFIFHAF